MWKRINTKTLLDNPRLRVLEDEVLLPDGSLTDYVYFDSSKYSCTIICRNNEGKLLLLKEYSYLLNDFIFQFSGGYAKEGEIPEETATRELLEETSMKAGSLRLLGKFLLNHRKTKNVTHLYLATDLEQAEGIPDAEEEDSEKHWFSEEEITEMIRRGDIIVEDTLASWSLYQINGKE